MWKKRSSFLIVHLSVSLALIPPSLMATAFHPTRSPSSSWVCSSEKYEPTSKVWNRRKSEIQISRRFVLGPHGLLTDLKVAKQSAWYMKWKLNLLKSPDHRDLTTERYLWTWRSSGSASCTSRACASKQACGSISERGKPIFLRPSLASWKTPATSPVRLSKQSK